MIKQTNIKSLSEIEKIIYSKPYDDLNDYLRGVRDMINLINGEENNAEIVDTIKHYI